LSGAQSAKSGEQSAKREERRVKITFLKMMNQRGVVDTPRMAYLPPAI